MEKESTYVIYTDASFDNSMKIGTYAIIIMQENKIIRRTVKRCRIQLKSSTECEIFAVHQAINIILSTYIKSDKKQKFKLRTDCVDARGYLRKTGVQSTSL